MLKTPVIFFSNNYLCKSTAGCAGSGVLKNAPTDLRNHVLNLMKTYGLLMGDNYLVGAKTESFVKVPPSALRQSEPLIKLFALFDSSCTLDTYEKLFDGFGLATSSDGSPIPISPRGIKLLRENHSFVNFYHCLDKDERVLHMIQERLSLKEIKMISYFNNGPYRYESIVTHSKMADILLQNPPETNNDHAIDISSLADMVFTSDRSPEQSPLLRKNELIIT